MDTFSFIPPLFRCTDIKMDLEGRIHRLEARKKLREEALREIDQ